MSQDSQHPEQPSSLDFIPSDNSKPEQEAARLQEELDKKIAAEDHSKNEQGSSSAPKQVVSLSGGAKSRRSFPRIFLSKIQKTCRRSNRRN